MAKMIVIEGLDGSGKQTQTEKLKKALGSKGLRVASLSFPRYGEVSASLVEEYLGGSFGSDPKAINAYGASCFFAMDRFASYLVDWKRLYEECDIFLVDRYVTSNAIHQCSKLPNEEWKFFLDWLFDFEHEKLRLPKPDVVIYLHLNVDMSQRLLFERYGGIESKKDIHERDIDYLRRSQLAAEFCCEYCGWERVECVSNGNLRCIEDIHGEIMEKVCG